MIRALIKRSNLIRMNCCDVTYHCSFPIPKSDNTIKIYLCFLLPSQDTSQSHRRRRRRSSSTSSSTPLSSSRSSLFRRRPRLFANRIGAILEHAQARIIVLNPPSPPPPPSSDTRTGRETLTHKSRSTPHDNDDDDDNSGTSCRVRRGRRRFQWMPGVEPRDVTLEMLLESAKAMDAAEIKKELEQVRVI